MTILELLQSPEFPSKNIIEKLLCYILGMKRTELFTHSDYIVSSEQLTQVRQWYTEYTISKKPLEYILGYVEFCGERFKVSPATLIPRPETEYMILAATGQALPEWAESTLSSSQLPDANITSPGNMRPITLIDVGTWSGVLWLSVLIHHRASIAAVYLTEYSPDAIEIAKQNYHQKIDDHKISKDIPVCFVLSDLLMDEKLQAVLTSPNNSILLVANLPYIPEQTFEDNAEDNVKKWEPKMAFVWGNDGLDLYRRMFDQIIATRKNNNTQHAQNTFTMYLEMMTRQVDMLRKEYESHFLLEEVATFHFNIRIVKGILLTQDN